MRNRLFSLMTILFIASTAAAFAQETKGAGRVEVTAFPGGGQFFSKPSGSTETDFRNFALGAGFTLNLNRRLAIEGEVGGGVGLKNDLSTVRTDVVTDVNGNPVLDEAGNVMVVSSTTLTRPKSPTTMGYQGAAVYSPLGNNHEWVPYVTGGVGGLTMFARNSAPELGLTGNVTYLTGNAGAGVKWFLARGWGLRADYRVIAVRHQDGAPAFFGRNDNRIGQRLYGSLIYTFGK